MQNLEIRKQALDDVKDAIAWYESQLDNLGFEFLYEFNQVVSVIALKPNLFQTRYTKIRLIHFHRFFYSIYYITEKEKIIVLAVFHQKRNYKTAIKRLRK